MTTLFYHDHDGANERKKIDFSDHESLAFNLTEGQLTPGTRRRKKSDTIGRVAVHLCGFTIWLSHSSLLSQDDSLCPMSSSLAKKKEHGGVVAPLLGSTGRNVRTFPDRKGFFLTIPFILFSPNRCKSYTNVEWNTKVVGRRANPKLFSLHCDAMNWVVTVVKSSQVVGV